MSHSGRVNLNDFYKREVFVKESTHDPEKGISFIGSYRYKGYSLFDLLHPFNQDKKNSEEFRPVIDLYVEIANDKGETGVFSWSEIFHTSVPHQILIATEVAPILPYRQDVEYPTGTHWRVVSAGDLFAFRTLKNPATITIRSFDKKNYVINRDIEPLYSPTIDVVMNDSLLTTIFPEDNYPNALTYYSTFYGMGMGFHESDHFKGPRLLDLLPNAIDRTAKEWNKQGLVCFVGVDGYRVVYSYSELFNRADQLPPILAVPIDSKNGGHFRNFHPNDFYADRSVKALKELYFFKP